MHMSFIAKPLYPCFFLFQLLSFLFINALPLQAQKTNPQCAQKPAVLNQYTLLINAGDTAAIIKLAAQYKAKDWPCNTLGYYVSIYINIERKDTTAVNKELAAYKKLLDDKMADSIFYADYYTALSRKLITANRYADAIQYQFITIALLENTTDTIQLIQNLSWTATTFYRMKQYQEMRVYGKKCLALLLAVTDFPKKAEFLTTASARYYLYYDTVKNAAYLDTAKLLANMALHTGRKFNNIPAILDAYQAISAVYHRRKDGTAEKLYNDSALMVAKKNNYNRQTAGAYQNISVYYRDRKDYRNAALYADSALPFFRAFGNTSMLMGGFVSIYKAHKLAGDYKEALDAYEQKVSISDSLLNLEKTQKIKELEEKYNQAKNEKTINELNQEKEIYTLQNRVLIIVSVAVLMALALIWFYFRQQNLKQQQKILEAEQRLNRARMNPHFFFNALATLQQYALTENNGLTLATNLSRFSNIMRETLESTYREYITIEQETDFLKEYLDLQQMRYEQKFTYDIIIAETVEPDEILLPAMIIQPFVENAVEHGFANIDRTGLLRIVFEIEADQLVIRITDNGKGLAEVKSLNPEHISRASQIIKDRIYLLNIKLKTRARFSIENRKDGQGVLVQIFLPVILKHENIADR